MATVYVNWDTGNDSTGDGTEGNPYKSINKAVTVAVKGTDTILSASSTSGQGWTNGTNWGGFLIKGADIPNLQNNTYTMLDGSGTNTGRIDVDGAFDSTFENLYFKDAIPGTTLFDYTDSSGDVTITFRNCIFENILIATNNNSRNGLLGKYTSGAPGADSITVVWDNCTFIDIAGNVTGGWIMNTAMTTPIFTTFRNCSFQFNSSISVPLYSIVDGSINYDYFVRFYNCIINNEHATELDVYRGADQDYLVFKNNCYQNVDISNGDNANNVEADPLFLDSANKNFRLKTGSPARNIGDISL